MVVVVVVVILEKEGAVMLHRGVPSLPQSRFTDLSTTMPFKMTFKKKSTTLT